MSTIFACFVYTVCLYHLSQDTAKCNKLLAVLVYRLYVVALGQDMNK